MKLLYISFFSILLVLGFTSRAEDINHSLTVLNAVDSSIDDQEQLFYRVADQLLLKPIYSQILGDDIGNSLVWLDVFAGNSVESLWNSDYLLLENNKSGGFEIYDDDMNYLSVAPDLLGQFYLEMNNGRWVKAKSNNFNKTYFSNENGDNYTVVSKISFGGKFTIRNEKGYEIVVKGNLTGGYQITDTEGRKLQIKYDRTGIYRLMEKDVVIKSLVIGSLQSFNIKDQNGDNVNVRMRGRFNDIIITLYNGDEIFIRNRFRLPTPPQNETK